MDVTEIFDEFTAHGFEDVEDAIKLAVLNETYQDTCARMPWPFLEAQIALSWNGASAVASNSPDDFRAAIKLMGSTYRWLPMRLDDVLEAQDRTGMRFAYYFLAGQLTVSPQPSAGEAATLTYLRIPDDVDTSSVSTDFLLPARYHRGILVNGSLYKLYALEDDTDLSATFERLYEKAISRAENDLWRQQYDAPDYIHQTDWDSNEIY